MYSYSDGTWIDVGVVGVVGAALAFIVGFVAINQNTPENDENNPANNGVNPDTDRNSIGNREYYDALMLAREAAEEAEEAAKKASKKASRKSPGKPSPGKPSPGKPSPGKPSPGKPSPGNPSRKAPGKSSGKSPNGKSSGKKSKKLSLRAAQEQAKNTNALISDFYSRTRHNKVN
jgi:hypothetical protein